MFKSYLKTIIRSFIKNKSTTLINVIGLSLAFCLFILLMLYVNNELTTDNYHLKADRIFRVISDEGKIHTTSSTLATFISENYPELEQACRTLHLKGKLSFNNQNFPFKQMCLADSNYFKIFSHQKIMGNLNSALSDMNGLVLTKSYAKKLFGDQNPINKVVQLGENNYWLKEGYSLVVKAVIEDVPENSSLKVDGFISFNMIQKLAPYMLNNENILNFTTWLLLNQQKDKEKIIEKLNQELQKRYYDWEQTVLQPLPELFFEKTNDDFRHGNLQLVYLFATLAVFIVFMACINYINLANAQASSRAKEVGLRKVVGASKWKLIFQFLLESGLITFISLIIGFVLAELFIGKFNLLANTNFEVKTFYQLKYIWAFIFGAVIISIFSGLYPSLVMIKFHPIDILKSRFSGGGKGLNLRRILLVTQFVISLIMIFGTIMIYQQLRYVNHLNLGFDKEKIIHLQTRDNLVKKDHPFNTQIKAIPGVEMIAVCSGIPGDVVNGMGASVEGKNILMRHLKMNEDFLDLMKINLVQGKGFTRDTIDISKTFMVNETAVKNFGWDDPMKIKIWGRKCVGVVKDFNFTSIHQDIGPLFFTYEGNMTDLCVKFSGNQITPLLNKIEQVWSNNFPERPFEFRFVDSVLEDQYKTEERLGKIVSYFAFISLFIASLGLFGLTSFIVNQRTKEIGIRKTLGSSSNQIIGMISFDFLKWFIVAFVIFIPAAWYIAHSWLDNFSYQTRVSWLIFALSGLLLALISALVIRLQTYRAASINPVDSLRYE